jgi:hypothetical protein
MTKRLRIGVQGVSLRHGLAGHGSFGNSSCDGIAFFMEGNAPATAEPAKRRALWLFGLNRAASAVNSFSRSQRREATNCGAKHLRSLRKDTACDTLRLR